MSQQHDFDIANQGFPAFRADLNNALQALAQNSFGATEPTTTYANQFWYDSANKLLKFRNAADSAWITFAYLDQANNEWELRSAVIQAVDSAGVVIKTDEGTTRLTIADDGTATFAGGVTVNGDITVTGTVDGIDLANATLNTDTDLSSGVDWASTNTDMSVDPNKAPTRSAVNTAIADAVTGVWDDQGGYDANTNTPDLDTSPSGSIKKGWLYTVTAAGTFFTENLEVGDTIVAAQDAPTTLAHWTIVQKNLDAASIKAAYESNSDTNAFTDADHSKLDGIEASADVTDTANVTAAGALMDSELTNESAVKGINQALATTSNVDFNDVTLAGILKTGKGADVASAAALTLGTDGNVFDVTGNTTITSIATWHVGGIAILQFDGALTLTHHATDLILPGGANIVTAAGDTAIMQEYASGDWRCVSYQRAANAPGGGISNVVEDLTPQLGGDLDFNGSKATDFESTGINDNATATAITLDSSNNVLVGQSTSTNPAGANIPGMALGSDGLLSASRDYGQAAIFGRRLDDGPVVSITKNGTTLGSLRASNGNMGINAAGGNYGILQVNGANRYVWYESAFYPEQDNLRDIGISSKRWNDIYATNGTIQTSDRNEKQDIEELSEKETRVAQACKGLLRKFRWIDAVDRKGDDARIHFGIIAQDLRDAFAAEGLDGGDYAMFISNTWWEHEVEVPAVEYQGATYGEDGELLTPETEAQSAYTRTDTYYTAEEAPQGAVKRTCLGVRYPELLAFIIAAI